MNNCCHGSVVSMGMMGSMVPIPSTNLARFLHSSGNAQVAREAAILQAKFSGLLPGGVSELSTVNSSLVAAQATRVGLCKQQRDCQLTVSRRVEQFL